MKRISTMFIAIMLMVAVGAPALAKEDVTIASVENPPIVAHPPNVDAENSGEEITIKENDFLVTYCDISDEQRESADKFMEPH